MRPLAGTGAKAPWVSGIAVRSVSGAGLGFGIWGLGFRDITLNPKHHSGSLFRLQGLGFKVKASLRAQASGFRSQGLKI